MRINISISPEDLHLIDDYCKATGIKRSTFLTRSALKEVGVHEKDIDHFYPKQKSFHDPCPYGNDECPKCTNKG